jgi:hypothetical protein
LLSKTLKLDSRIIKPGKKDLISGLIALPCLLLTGFVIALLSELTSGDSEKMTLFTPSTFTGWAVLCIFCFITAYLEECFFRFYLLSKRTQMNLTPAAALAISTALFSICHIYAGSWGFLNAIISGLILGLLYLRFESIHGISIAHAFYNISAYAFYTLIS